MSENLAELYFKKLYKAEKPGNLLCEFYSKLFDREYNRSHLIMMNKLIKIYGRETLFFAILSINDVKDLTHDNLYPLMTYLCKKHLIAKVNGNGVQNLEHLHSRIKEIEKKIEKVIQTKRKIRSLYPDEE